MIADSNHGYKMIGVGELVADELMGDAERAARAVPLLALRSGAAAPGQQQPVSLELTMRAAQPLRATPGHGRAGAIS